MLSGSILHERSEVNYTIKRKQNKINYLFCISLTLCYLCKANKIYTMIGTVNVNDVYMDMLGTLPNEDKLDLISRLVKSMKKAVAITKEPKDVFARFSSDWGGSMTTEEYSDMLRSENIDDVRTVDTW